MSGYVLMGIYLSSIGNSGDISCPMGNFFPGMGTYLSGMFLWGDISSSLEHVG